MRRSTIFVSAIVLALGLVPRVASAQAQAGVVQGFGGFRLGDTSTVPSFGGSVAINVTPKIQFIGEAGRISNMMPLIVGDLLSVVPVDFHVSAVYGEGGVRFIASPRSIVSGYVEGTAGIARLRPGLSSIGQYTGVANALLRVLDRTEPIASLGGGVIVHGGRLSVDLGYRYKKIIISNPVLAVLSLGSGMTASQVRLAIGIRF